MNIFKDLEELWHTVHVLVTNRVTTAHKLISHLLTGMLGWLQAPWLSWGLIQNLYLRINSTKWSYLYLPPDTNIWMASTTAHLYNNLIMCSSLDTSKIWRYKTERARDNHPGSLSKGHFWKYCYQQKQGLNSTARFKLVLSKSRQSHTWRISLVGFSEPSY